jgi:hypothetical protein
MSYREKKIKIPIYYADFYIIDTDDNNLLKKKHKIEIEGVIFAQTEFTIRAKGNALYETHFAIFNFNLSEGFKPEFDAIAHEAFHLTVNLFKQKNIKLDWMNDEPYAYMIGWFVREITKFVYQ